MVTSIGASAKLRGVNSDDGARNLVSVGGADTEAVGENVFVLGAEYCLIPLVAVRAGVQLRPISFPM